MYEFYFLLGFIFFALLFIVSVITRHWVAFLFGALGFLLLGVVLTADGLTKYESGSDANVTKVGNDYQISIEDKEVTRTADNDNVIAIVAPILLFGGGALVFYSVAIAWRGG